MAYAGFTRTLPAPASTLGGFVFVMNEDWFTQADANALDGTTFINGGGSLRVYTDSSKTTRLPLHIQVFTTGGTPEVLVWFRVPSYASGDSVWIESDETGTAQPGPSSTYGSQEVWQDFRAVYLLDEDVNNSTGGYKDSTSNGFHATGTEMSIPTSSGQFGKAQNFDGFADVISMPASVLNSAEVSNKLTISCWANPDSNNTDGTLVGRWGDGLNQILLYLDADGANPNFRMGIFNTSGSPVFTDTDTGTSVLGFWQHVTGSWDGSVTKIYRNGSLTNQSTSTPSNLISRGEDIHIGADSNPAGRQFDGGIHAVTLRDDIPSNPDAYNNSQYLNQTEPSTFGTSSGWTTGGGGLTITPTGIASGESFGSPTLSTGLVVISPSGIATEASVGSPSVGTGLTTLSPPSIDSAEAFGTAEILRGLVSILPASVASGEGFGTASVNTGLTVLSPTSIESQEVVNSFVLTKLLEIIEVTGIQSEEFVSRPLVEGGDSILIPVINRETLNEIADYLRTLGFKGQVNDVIMAWLVSEGLEGSFNDMFYEYLGNLNYEGSLGDMFSKWKGGL